MPVHCFYMDSRLELRALTRTGLQNSDGTFKSERHFLDFVIDGQSLWETLRKPDMASVLCAQYVEKETANAVSRLLLNQKADLPNGRRSLFICSECGDLGCGAISVVVERQAESFTWNDFGYENTYEDKISLDAYRTIGPFTFDAIKYEQTLIKAVDLLRRIET
jgi:hypothetical protein